MRVDFEETIRRVKNSRAKRLVVVFNPRSSKAKRVTEEVLEPAKREFSHDKFATYEVLPTNVDDNAEKLAKFLKDGDAVVAAGGDGTAAIALNGAMLSEKEIYFAALPYGNFNDMARSLRKAPQGSKLYPIEAVVNGKHFRFAACYFTLGLFAESTEIFDGKKMRKSLQTGKKAMTYSILQLAKWYFQNKKREFLPKFKIERGEVRNSDGAGTQEIKMKARNSDCVSVREIEMKVRTSDYMAVNGVSIAKMMRGGKWYLEDDGYWAVTGRLTNFFRLCLFMAKSILFRVPGKKSYQDKLVFEKPATLEIQAEGEYKKLKDIKEIEFKKAKKYINII